MISISQKVRHFVSSKQIDGLFIALSLCCWTSTSSVESCEAAAEKLSVSNAAISVTLNTADATLSVTDKRTGQIWRQKSLTKGEVSQSRKVADGIEITWRQPGLGIDVEMKLQLDGDNPEFTLALSADGNLKWSLGFPHPFVTDSGTYLVVPMNEGISYPVDDKSIDTRWLVAYGGHGICMAFWGVTDGEQGHMAIIETPDDARIHINRLEGKLCVAPKWDSQKGRFGYTRKLRYVFFDDGGHVRHLQTLSLLREEGGFAQNTKAKTQRKRERGFAYRGGERLVLGEGRPCHSSRDEIPGYRADSVEPPQAGRRSSRR